MINAVRVAAAIVERLPKEFLPETTEGREPYLHPYELKGDVTQGRAQAAGARLLRRGARRARGQPAQRGRGGRAATSPGRSIEVEIKESYRNMAHEDRRGPEGARRTPWRRCGGSGIEPVRRAIRGGTDGARLSFMGLLTPNIWAGGQSFHSVQEWVSLEWMAKAVECTLHLLQVWVERSR